MNLDLEQMVQDVHDGNESPLKVYAILNDVLKTAKKCQDEIKDYALQESEKYKDKTFEEDGFIFEKRNGGKRWSFKHLEDWTQIKNSLIACEEKYKLAYKNKENGLEAFNTSTGEEIELPKVTYSLDSLIVKG